MPKINKTPLRQKKTSLLRTPLLVVAVLVVSAALVVSNTQPQTAQADEYDEKIATIQKEIDAYEQEAKKLAAQSDSLKRELALLSNQKAAIQAQIDESEARRKKVLNDIEVTKQRITNTKDALGYTLADMYVEDSITPLEMLAGSDNIGDYIDKQEYRATVRDNLTGKIEEIKILKKKLEDQKIEVERQILNQKNSRSALEATEKEQAALLAKTQNDESRYQSLKNNKEAEKAQVQQAQQAAIEAAIRAAAARNNTSSGGSAGYTVTAGDPNKGGYPFEGNCYVDGNAYSHGGYNGRGEDPWGYGCRQCVSYTAWKVHQTTGYTPYYWGNANMWPASARAAGFSTGSAPRANSLGVISAGTYGHIVYVHGYNQAQGTVTISQYNFLNAGGPGWGHYSEMVVPAWTYDTYIYL